MYSIVDGVSMVLLPVDRTWIDDIGKRTRSIYVVRPPNRSEARHEEPLYRMLEIQGLCQIVTTLWRPQTEHGLHQCFKGSASDGQSHEL